MAWNGVGYLIGDIHDVVVDNSTEIEIVEEHLHNRERWYGKSADQSGTDWAAENLTPYRVISGTNTWGADENDEAKVWGLGDGAEITGHTKMDIHRIFLSATSSNTPWRFRLIYGTGTMAAAINAGQYSSIIVAQDDTNPQQAVGVPVDILMQRVTFGTDKIWAQGWNATNNATLDFFVGQHGYDI